MRIFVLGASGGVGSRFLALAKARGHALTAQTRDARNLGQSGGVRITVGAPTDGGFLRRNLGGHDAVVLCIGVDRMGPTTVFSDVTGALIPAMQASGVKRLVAITGIGAGDSKGHGGWFYNHIVFPLVTRNRYLDKDRQEAMIERSDLDWTIVRPAPFAAGTHGRPLQVHTTIPPGLQLKAVTRADVAAFVLDCLENDGFLKQKPFIGCA